MSSCVGGSSSSSWLSSLRPQLNKLLFFFAKEEGQAVEGDQSAFELLPGDVGLVGDVGASDSAESFCFKD